jgi:hypothetical protein
MIASLVNISRLTFNEPFNYASSVLAIVFLVLLALASLLEACVIRKHQANY